VGKHFALPKNLHPGFTAYRRKPSGRIAIDWSNPLTRGLRYCQPCNSHNALELVSNTPDTINGNVRFSQGGFVFGGTTADYISSANTFDKDGGGSIFSAFVVAKFAAHTNAYPLLIGRGDTAAGEWMIRDADTGGSVSQAAFYGNAGSYNAAKTGSLNEDRVEFVGATVTTGGVGLYVGGKLVASDVTGSLSTTSNSKLLTLGGADSDTDRPFKGTMYLVLGYSRGLTVGEHAALARNPYQIFKPATQQTYFLPLAAGATSITATDSAQAQASDTATATQHHVAAATDSAQAQVSDTATATQHHVASATDSAQAQASDTVSVVLRYTVTATDSAQAQVSDTATATQHHVAAATDSAQAQASDTATATQHHVAAATDSAQAQAADRAGVTQHHTTAVMDTAQTQVSDTGPLTLHHVAAATDSAQAQVSDTVYLATLLSATDSAQAQVSDTATATHEYALGSVDSRQTQASDTASITQHHVAAATDSAQAQVSDTATVTQHHVAPATDSAQAQASDTVALTHKYALASVDVAQTQASDTVIATQHHIFVVRKTWQLQRPDAPALDHDDILAGVLPWIVATNYTPMPVYTG